MFVRFAIASLGVVLLPAYCRGQMTPEQTQKIIQQSAQATHADWKRAPGYDFCETDKAGNGSRTFAVLMIEGSPYNRLVQVNGHDLSPGQEAEQRRNLKDTREGRQQESPDQRSKRVAQYEKERHRNQQMLEQLTKAMKFKFAGTGQVDSHFVDIFDATPRPGYVPPNMETQVLTAMKGTLSIDRSSFRWAKAEAQVMKPVSIAGFLARVEPGTRFELEESPVTPDLWLPSHFKMRARAKIILLFNKRSQADETYFNYKPTGKLSPDDCRSNAASRQP